MEDPQDNLKIHLNNLPLTQQQVCVHDEFFRDPDDSLDDAIDNLERPSLDYCEGDTLDLVPSPTRSESALDGTLADTSSLHTWLPTSSPVHIPTPPAATDSSNPESSPALEIRRSLRPKWTPAKFHDYEHTIPGKSSLKDHDASSPALFASQMQANAFYSPDHIISFNNVMKIHEHLHYSQASNDKGWQAVMQAELDALEANHT